MLIFVGVNSSDNCLARGSNYRHFVILEVYLHYCCKITSALIFYAYPTTSIRSCEGIINHSILRATLRGKRDE